MWDIVFWTNEDAADYVPSVWAHSDCTQYKYACGPRMTQQKIRQLILECVDLDHQQFQWFPATVKRIKIKSLEKVR